MTSYKYPLVKYSHCKPENPGFTLIELAIVLIITATLLVAAIQAAIPVIREARIVGTQAKLDKIARAIDYYATQNFRVPCPAVPLESTTNPPFGFESGSGANGDAVPADCGALKSGITPFKTLGIPVDWVRDAWGNYITYAISPAFSLDTTADIPVQARCRTSDWYNSAITYEPGQLSTPVYIHSNPRKARFCCPYPSAFPPSTDLVIKDAAGNPQLVYGRADGAVPIPNGSSVAPTSETYPNPMAASTYPPNSSRPTAPTYILVSHGANGHGAYNTNSGVRNSTVGATPDEIVNASDTGTFFEIPKLDRATAERGYDDVVEWRTQDLIFASQGQTCAGP